VSKNGTSSLPKGWQWKQFGECARLINGRAYSQDELLDSGTPVLRIQNLNGGDRWYYSNLHLPEDKYCWPGDLLFAWSASFGPYRFSGPKSIFHYHIWRVIPNDILDKRFAYYLLEWMTEKVKAAAHGVAMLHMTKAGMESWTIPLPPLEEQRRIAEVLDRAEVLRAKRCAALAQLDFLTQSIFLDLFGDPRTNPKRWESSTVGDVAEQVTDGEHVTPKRTRTGIKLLSARNIRDGYLDFAVVDYISEDEFDRLKRRCNPRVGDVLISCSGTIGRVAPIETTEPLALVRSVALVRPKKALLLARFLEHYLRTPALKIRMLNRANASSQANLFQNQIRALPVYLPPMEVQNEFSRQVEAIKGIRVAQTIVQNKLDSLFLSLQHRTFRGEM
jgi:type I restriction enzyme, S subunit